jgi:DMSO/TMAO reductase YedYZ molybdopterin-dependent catalytic subunit
MSKKSLVHVLTIILLSTILLVGSVHAATTEVDIVRYANDGVTILEETTVNYTWMEANLPVLGDGVTHYYHQGPVFVDDANETLEQELRWNPEEDTNIQEKDQGAVKGTNLKDLCDLVGGMSAGEEVKVISSDGFTKWFAYENVYQYSSREGPIGLTWYRDGDYPDTGYPDGMKLVWFADTSVNPWGYNVFGNYDWHEAAAEEYWYYYQEGEERYPTTTGLSSKYVNRIYIYSDEDPPSIDELFNGIVSLTEGGSFTVTAYNSDTEYTVNQTTPLGALDAAGTIAGFTYDVTDKNFASSGALLLDNIGTYLYQKTPRKAWYAYVNDNYKDGYDNPAGALNLIELNDGDTVEFYYVEGDVADPTDITAVKAAASAAVKITADIEPAGPVTDTLFDGTVTLTPGETFTVTAYNSDTEYTVNQTTPLGALDAAGTIAGFTYDVTDKNFASSGALLLDNIGTYLYQKTPRKAWYAYVNDNYKDGYDNPAGALNLIELNDGDTVEFYYVEGDVADPTDITAVKAAASAAVKTVADISGTSPTGDWTLSLSGARSQTVTKTYFEEGLACPSSGHMVSYTDTEGGEWSGVPLWLLVAMVDDDPDSGPDHYNFNDDLAAQGYSVKVTAGDGYEINFESADIARNNDYIVANTLDGKPLPLEKPNSTKLCFPLQMIGPAVSSGQLVGNITSIELVGLPEPPAGWTLTMEGEVVDTITQAEFADAIACTHQVTYDDGIDVWGGVPLWELVGAVDDIETTAHWTFNDDRAAAGYTIRVSAGDGYSRTFASADVARSGNYIVANTKNGEPLTDPIAPLRLVGANVTGGARVGNIETISLEGLPSYPDGDWCLQLDGAISDTIPQPEFEDWAACHPATYDDGAGNVYEGIPLWRLMGWVDDRIPHGPNGFNNALASAGYTVIVTAGDGYSKELPSQQIGTTDGFIVANVLNGQPLPTDGSHPPYPLRLVGAGLPSASYSIGNIARIELTDFQEPTEIPTVTIIKYASDGTTVIDQTTVDHVWMEANLPVVGDGETHYVYQGVTLDPDDIWDPTETKGMNPPKIDNAIKGTKVRDLCELVGGMEPGTEITFVATDGYETTLPYDAIYPNPYIYSHIGESVIAWYADGNYVPQYGDGPRLFFAPEDLVVGQWDMHEALPEQYWHYYWDGGVQYPSVAGLSAKYISTIRIYSAPVTEWSFVLDGTALGGLNQTISRNYFESALACQFGAEHSAEYTDTAARTWSGMPLWFLCGFVDDDDQHSDNAYNDTLALAGYDIVITAGDGYSATIDSGDTMRNSNYIVANTLNGTPFADTDSNWPLRLTGADVSGGLTVKGIEKIELIPKPGPGFTATLEDGWNTISTPVLLDSEHDTFYEIFDTESQRNVLVVLGWNGQQWFIPDSEYVISPLDAFFVKVDGSATARFIPSETVSSLPARYLDGGISLVGPAPAYSDGTFPATPVDEALISIEYAPGGLIGYTIVVSPAYNQPGWSYPRGGTVNDLLPFKGYWVVMENPDTLYGFSTTPIV